MNGKEYLVDLSSWPDERFNKLWELLPHYDAYKIVPVYGVQKTFTVLWCEDKPMEEVLGIPSGLIRPLP